MKGRSYIAVLMGLGFLLAASPYKSAYGKGMLDDLGLPEFPGSKLLTEVNLPKGKLLDSLEKQFGPYFGLTEMKEVNLLIYGIARQPEAEEVFKFYEPFVGKQEWSVLVRSLNQGKGLAVLFNEGLGMFMMIVDSPDAKDRQLAMLRISGKIDPSKMADPERKLPDFIREMVGEAGDPGGSVSRIPIGQPISVPPSEKLHLKATRSAMVAEFVSGNTAEIRVPGRADEPGELTRAGDLLVLSLAPGLSIGDVSLPGDVPVIVELTDGSLTLSSNPAVRISRLSVVATSAPVTLDGLPLVSGTHSLKVVGDKVSASFFPVKGGAFDMDVTGGDVAIALPKDASATLEISAPSASIDNRTGIEPARSSANGMTLKFGDGKAAISVKAVGGTVRITLSD